MTIDEDKLQKIVLKHLPAAFVGWGYKGFMCQVHYPGLLKIVDDYTEQIIHEALKKQREICADMAKVFMPSHPALHLTTNVNKEEIKNAPEPEL